MPESSDLRIWPLWVMAGLTALLLITSTFSISVMWFLNDRLDIQATEMRILALKIDEQNAILIREGIRRPGDAWHGPTQNPNYQRGSE